jgi:hypothetical protein
LLSDLRNYTYYILRPYKSLNELLIPILITEAKAEIEYIIEGEIIIEGAIIREKTLPAKETLTPLKVNKKHSNKECKLNKLISVNIFVIEDKTISNIKFFADAIFY